MENSPRTLTEVQPKKIESKVLRYGESLAINPDIKMGPEKSEILKELDIEGDIISELYIGEQKFLILDISDATNSNGIFSPFGDGSPINRSKPIHFAIEEHPALLLVQTSDKNGLIAKSIRKNEPITLGREAELLIPELGRFEYQQDDTVSRFHTQITLDSGGDIIVKDLESTNGTEVYYATESQNKLTDELAEIRDNNNSSNFVTDPEKIKLSFKESGSMSAETNTLINNLNLKPSIMLNIEGREFFISNIADGRKDDMYQEAVLYTTINQDGKDIIVPRLLYKSNSDGGWRVAYGIEPSGRAIKETRGSDSHYVQETKLQPEILDAIEKVSLSEASYDLIEKMHNIFTQSMQNVIYARQEISYYTNPYYDGLVSPLRVVSAGWLGSAKDIILNSEFGKNFRISEINITNFFKSLDGTFNSLPGFVPDFSQKPNSVEHREHTILGDIVIESYSGVFGSEPITWFMAHDKDGRVWVENIIIDNNKPSSYGTYSTIFDAGILTSKPLDYTFQTDDLSIGTERVRYNDNYYDITPALDNLLPIRQYRQAKNINISR